MEISGYEKKDIDFIRDLKENRINVQYYLRPSKQVDTEKVKTFIETSKKLLLRLDIEDIRKKIKEYLE